MKFNICCCCATLLTVAVLSPIQVTESSSLIKSPWANELDDIFSILFGTEGDQPLTKYDRQSNKWVEKCPEIECLHGKDDGDTETCPSCLLGPGENCSEWKGKCGDHLVCQYASAYSTTGNCVTEEEFNSRKANESCGHWEGQCGDDLKCLVEPDLWTHFCGVEESGMCVTEEEFSTREEGETCGGSAGKCKEGLECAQSETNWFTKECQNLTEKAESSTEHHSHVFSMEEIIDQEDNEHPGKHITIEVISDGPEDEELIDSFLESEMLSPMLGDEIEMIENMVHSLMVKPDKTPEDREETASTVSDPDQQDDEAVVVKIDDEDIIVPDLIKHITFDSEAKSSDEAMESAQISVKSL